MSFDFIAQYYTKLSVIVFGNTLETAKTSLFHKIPDTAHVLFIGGGTGVSLKTLVQLKPHAYIDYVEASKQMILQAKGKLTNEKRVRFHHQPIEVFAGENYDVVISEFVLDLFTQKENKVLIPFIALKMKPDGCWIDTDFRVTPQLRHKVLLKTMYSFFKITAKVSTKKLVAIKPIMKCSGFTLKNEQRFKGGFITSYLFVRP